MGYWDLINTTPPVTAQRSLQNNSLSTPYKVYQRYFGDYTTNGTPYSYSGFRTSVREARNHGLNLSSSLAHAMRLLAKHSDDWFNEDGTLKEGLSRHEAERAKKYKAEVQSYYDRIKPRKKKKEDLSKIQGRWAASNFIKNGYDLAAALRFAGITDYNGLAELWGGDTTGVKAGGIYGDKAALAEKNYFDSLSTPEKRAYLNLRQLWILNNLISGSKLADLGSISESDMQDYIRKNLYSWYMPFYGESYEDEYGKAHATLSPEDKARTELYGLPVINPGTGTWTPEINPLRTSGFTLSKVEKAKKAVKKKKEVKKDAGKTPDQTKKEDKTKKESLRGIGHIN